MRPRYAISLLTILTTAAATLAQPTVTLTLESTQAGQTVPPGTTIDWTITVGVSTSDNEGLALIACNLVQDAANPAFLDLPPGDAGSIDATMQNFNRPDGISNPGEGAATGYVGVQRGDPGAMNLRQIGGGQNTFGEALPPGTGVGESADIVPAVGQGTPQTLLSGSFAAPAAEGTYAFGLTNALANVITELNTPPLYSPVTGASVDGSTATFSVTVTLIGDLDLDCDVDLSDLAQLLGNYGTTSGMGWTDGDLDGDSDVDLSDLAALLGNYGESCP